ncbi:MAG: beta-hydroxyacyl-ACP dehydratase [Brevibacillus sp.]|nr:beta-hydroxyacyl-ACP dehydratase [Brevibacillus sp.]
MKAEQLLGYRKPWVLVDNVLTLKGNDRIVAQKLITSSDYFLQGHFPQYSIYPGMLVIEGLKQSAELLFALTAQAPPGRVRIRSLTARFAKPLEPGDTVTFDVMRLSGEEGLVLTGRAAVAGEDVVRARFTMEKEDC